MRLAYLTTQYPKVSHTFIRREILELERRGHEILRLAVREPEAHVVDPVDLAEQQRAIVCLSQPRLLLLSSCLRTIAGHPMAAFRALRRAIEMAIPSDRSLLRHVAYFVEACFFFRLLQQRMIQHLHVHFGTNAAAVARLIRALGGCSYSVTFHGPDEFDAPVGLSLQAKVEDAAFAVAVSAYGAA